MSKTVKGLTALCVVLLIVTISCCVSVSKFGKVVDEQKSTIIELQSENNKLNNQLDNLTSAQITLDILQSKIDKAEKQLQEAQSQTNSSETAN